MNTIIVTNQQELDALPSKFETYTTIEIRSSTTVVVLEARGNSSVVARGNSSVEARGNSSVVARGNSSVVALDNSSVVARGNSSVVAWDNSSVEAWGNSSVEARDNSSVVALDNSSVVAWDNSSVVAWDNSSVEARGNSSVEARDNSSVVAWDNSSVVARENSSVVARGNSSVVLMICAYVIVLSSRVVVKKLLDYSTAVFRGCPENIVEKSETSTSKVVPGYIELSFQEWLRRGYVYADGISKKLKSQKKIGEIEVYECENFPKKSSSYVVKKGELFSHGETVEKAIEDLRYKIGNRDTAEFESWRDLNKEITLDEAITGYRVITGACEFGVKEFVKSKTFEEKLTPKKIVELTVGQFGNEKLSEFLSSTT